MTSNTPTSSQTSLPEFLTIQTQEQLAQATHVALRKRLTIGIEQVVAALSEFRLPAPPPVRTAPRLQICRVRIQGIKRLRLGIESQRVEQSAVVAERMAADVRDHEVLAPAGEANESIPSRRGSWPDQDPTGAVAASEPEENVAARGSSSSPGGPSPMPTSQDTTHAAEDEGFTVLPFDYQQRFKPGVNVLQGPHSNTGKSSILKTIKFALTGNSELDKDVGGWIRDAWVAFSLGPHTYTTVLHQDGGLWSSAMVMGEECRPLAEASALAPVIFTAASQDQLKEELHKFFLQRLNLNALTWTQVAPNTGAIAERRITWSTYFQALFMPPGSEEYLLCDAEHSIANQPGLVLSEFLGLRHVDILNRLQVEAAKLKKEADHKKKLSQQRTQEETKTRDELNARLRAASDGLRLVDERRNGRRASMEASQRASAECSSLRLQKDDLADDAARWREEAESSLREGQKLRARARRLREAVSLGLHLTGLEVSVCPCCDSEVDEEDIQNEREQHRCRLCGRPPKNARSAHDLQRLAREATDLENDAARQDRRRSEALTALDEHETRLKWLNQRIADLERVAQDQLSNAIPSAEEDMRRSALDREAAQVELQLGQISTGESAETTLQHQEETARILSTAREILRKDADRLNLPIMSTLSSLTKDLAQRVGALSINELKFSSLGILHLQKHGQHVQFTGIKTPGERLRVKLALFLTLIQLGARPGFGKHPGLLLIDEPGAHEMPQPDVIALARSLRAIEDSSDSASLQIICATTREEFCAATTSDKVCGPQAGTHVF